MIDPGSGIELYMAPYHPKEFLGHYVEYIAPPCSPFHTGSTNERYIEAVTDERFEVGLFLPASFSFKQSTHAKFTIELDGGVISGVKYLEKPKGRGKEVRSTAASQLCEVNGQWKRIGFTFGVVEAVENLEMSNEDEDREAAQRGKVVVTVQLGRRSFVRGQKPNIIPALRPDLAMKSSKKVTVDKGKSHSVQYNSPAGNVIFGDADRLCRKVILDVDEGKVETMTRGSHWIPSHGKTGEPVEFTFFYASRMILELKKIIPSVPTSPLTEKAQPELSTDKSYQQTGIERRDEDDEETTMLPPPRNAIKRTKTEVVDDELMIITPPQTPAKRVKMEPADDDVTVVSERARNKIKVENAEGGRNQRTMSVTPTNTTWGVKVGGQTAKGKERAKLELQLEEVKIRQRLMELEEGE